MANDRSKESTKPLWDRGNPGVQNSGPSTKVTGDNKANTSDGKSLPVTKSLSEK